MKDKSLDIWLMVLFGASGMAVIALAWLWPVLASERVAATIAGFVGLLVAFSRAFMLRQSAASAHGKNFPAAAKLENRS
jgi:hypothetical protein